MRILAAALLLSALAAPVSAQTLAERPKALPDDIIPTSPDTDGPFYAAVRQSLAGELADAAKIGYEGLLTVGSHDLNGDGQDEIVARILDPMGANPYFCGMHGCQTYVYGLIGGQWKILRNGIAQAVGIGSTKTNGYTDLVNYGNPAGPVRLRFNGQTYVSATE